MYHLDLGNHSTMYPSIQSFQCMYTLNTYNYSCQVFPNKVKRSLSLINAPMFIFESMCIVFTSKSIK